MKGQPAYIVRVGDLWARENDSSAALAQDLAFRLQESEWVANAPEYELIHNYIAELKAVRTEREFAVVWEAIMGEAHYARTIISFLA